MRDEKFIQKVVNHFNNTPNATVRETAGAFNISKSTVYVYLTEVMPNPTSAAKLKKNKEERHMRGGLATKNKYLKMRS